MSPIEESVDYWVSLKTQIKDLQEQEKLWREYLLKVCFTEPVDEGTIKKVISPTKELKAEYGLDRKVDWTAYQAAIQLPEWRASMPETIVGFKPQLDLKTYRTLPASTRLLMDNCLVIKPKAVILTLVEKDEQ